MSIRYVIGDATRPEGTGPKIIASISNDRGGWGKGFVLAISKRWEEPEQCYRRWYRMKEGFELGATQLVQVEPYVWVANMVAQHGYKTGSKGPPIRYNALAACLEKVHTYAVDRGASVHMPRIGCGLAGAKWGVVQPIIEEKLGDLPVFVYDVV